MNLSQPIPLLLSLDVPVSDSTLLRDAGTSYSMAQAVRWLDQKNFAVGRWDGTLTVFHRDTALHAPLISAALIAPSFDGIQMIARIQSNLFASSNDGSSMLVWKANPEFSENGIRICTKLLYDPEIGVANDGTTTVVDGTLYFISGHKNGYLLIWAVEGDDNIELIHRLDLRSPSPIPSPYKLFNIRGVERWRPGYVATGSEDGDLCLIDVPGGKVIARVRYNPSAERGINDIDTSADYLLVANCSVGEQDRNLWLYRISDQGFELLDSVNLKIGTAKQVFNFCVDQAQIGGKHYFFAATEQGVVWTGLVENNKLTILGNTAVSTSFGAALAYQPASNLLAVAGDNLHLFEVR